MRRHKHYASPSPSHDATTSHNIWAYIVRYTTHNISWIIAPPTAFYYTPQTITITPTSNTLPLTSFIPHNGQAKTITLCLLPPTFATATPFGQKPCATTCISNSTHEEPKLYTRRTQAPHTKKPFTPYRTNLFRKQIYVQKFGHKNHIRKPSVATRKGPGRLSSSNRGPSYKISIEHFR